MDANDGDEFETPERNFKKKKVAETFDGKLVYERYFKPLTRQHTKYDGKKEQHICTCGVIRTCGIRFSNLMLNLNLTLTHLSGKILLICTIIQVGYLQHLTIVNVYSAALN